jgi:Leucine-rich repeat (LRR) protein
MRAFIKIVGLALASTTVGLLLNMSASEIDPAYAPYVVRWGWFIVVCGFTGYVANLAGAHTKLSVSWIQTGSRPLWPAAALAAACGYLGGVYWGVNALWDKIAIKHAVVVAHNDRPIMPGPSAPTGQSSKLDPPRAYPHKPSMPTMSPGEAMEKLVDMGWLLNADKTQPTKTFTRPVNNPPDVADSAKYFRLLDAPFSITFYDMETLETLVEMAALRGIKQFTSLSITSSTKLLSLNGIQGLTTLQTLVLTGVEIVDLTPVASLTELHDFSINDNHVTWDISAIKPLHKLARLSVMAPIADASVLVNFPRLSFLHLGNSDVSDLSPLNQLAHLTELQIGERELPAMSNVNSVSVNKLDVSFVNFSGAPLDLSPIRGLKGLETLNVSPPRPLRLTALRELPKISDLTIIAYGPNPMQITPVPLMDADASAELRGMRKLCLVNVYPDNLKFLSQMNQLDRLVLNFVPTNDFNVLSTLHSLTWLQIIGSNVFDISPLLELHKLKKVTLMRIPARVDVINVLRQRGVEVDDH